MPDDARQRYLAELDRALPFPQERRAEIIEEIGAHLDDAVTHRLDRGVPNGRAEALSQAELGAPTDLARDLARTDQAAWRLLAAVGAGVRAGVGPGIYGFVLATVFAFVLTMAVLAVLQSGASFLGSQWMPANTDQGWNTLVFAAAAALGLSYAGESAVRSVSVTSHRLHEDVRPWVATVGAVLAAGILVFAIDAPHNAVSVVGMALAPLAFAIGVYRPDLVLRPSGRWLVIVAGLILLLPLGYLISGASAADVGGESQFWHGAEEERLAVAGQRWTDPTSGELISGSSGWSSDGRSVTSTWEIGAASIAGLTDLAIEAWRADPVVLGTLDPRWDEPFAVGEVERAGAALTGTVVTTSEPGISHWSLVLTGVGPDGTRYVVADGGGGNSTFTGSAWDWLVAVSRD